MHRSVRGPLARVGRWPRLLAAAACLLLAAVSAIGAAHRSPAAARAPVRSTPVVVAAHDLPAGRVLTAGDLSVVRWPRANRPPGAVGRPAARVGARLAGPIRAGEAVTGTRLVGASLADGLAAGLTAVPVPIPQTQAVGLLRPGGVVELLATPQNDLGTDPTLGGPGSADGSGTSPPEATVVARRLLVLAVLPPARDELTSDGTATLVVAADPATALDIATAQSVDLLLAVPEAP